MAYRQIRYCITTCLLSWIILAMQYFQVLIGRILAANMSSTRLSHHMVQVHIHVTLSIPGSNVSQSYEASLMQLSTCSSILEPACAPYDTQTSALHPDLETL